jgi:hypothetical protein
MRTTNSGALLAGPAVVLLLALPVFACGGPPATVGQPGGEANNGEAPAVPYVDARYHYRIEAPGKMVPKPDGTASVIGPSERLEVAVLEGPAAADPQARARADASGLGASLAGFKLDSGPASVTISGRRVQKLVYRYSAGTSQVTGKPIDLVGVRYFIPKDSSTLAVVSYGVVVNQYDPQGADDVASTFQWQ